MVDKGRINETMGKMAHYLENHNSICVSVSGGGDSNVIVHIIATYFREYLPKIFFVFEDTGLEYEATRRHLRKMEDIYDIKIKTIRGRAIPTTIKEYGVPVLSKEVSTTAEYALKGSKWAMDKVNAVPYYSNTGKRAKDFSPKKRELLRYIVDNNIKVSSKCCYFSKKKPVTEFMKKNKCDLNITGVRRSENGQRALSIQSCFISKRDGMDQYMPLFFWDDETKEYYKDSEGIVFSDCYEVWGMKRTGCVGCPYNSKAGQDLLLIKKYEPKMYKACLKIFGESYLLTERFNIHKQKMDDEIIKDIENSIGVK